MNLNCLQILCALTNVAAKRRWRLVTAARMPDDSAAKTSKCLCELLVQYSKLLTDFQASTYYWRAGCFVALKANCCNKVNNQNIKSQLCSRYAIARAAADALHSEFVQYWLTLMRAFAKATVRKPTYARSCVYKRNLRIYALLC